MAENQLTAARNPMEVMTIHSGSENKKFAWHVAQVFLDKPRLGLTSIVVLSLHLNNAHAKKPVAGPNAIAEIIDTAATACLCGRLP